MSRHDKNRYRDRDPVALWAPDAGHPDPIALRSIGFWLYMMSDAMIFAGLFAAHGVYLHAYGTSHITASQVIDPVEGLLPTLFLFASVLMFGLASVALKNDDRSGVQRWMGASLGLGVLFIVVELWEFADLLGQGAVPQASAFLSDFWTIVWVHGGRGRPGWDRWPIPLFSRQAGAVDASAGPVQPISLMQLLQQHLVQPIPDPRLLPVPESTPARHTRAAAHLLGQYVPRNARAQYEQNAGQRCPIGNRRATAARAHFRLRQQRLHNGPEFVGYDLRGHT
ncbi:cytochrome o ubiquinol oxidase subunit III [Salinisphaera hydrothermalis C27AD]